MKKENNLNYPKSAAMGVVSKGLNNEFETAKVNEPSVFEPLKFYCVLPATCTCARAARQCVHICAENMYMYILEIVNCNSNDDSNFRS